MNNILIYIINLTQKYKHECIIYKRIALNSFQQWISLEWSSIYMLAS